jgi:MraZ protein
MSLLFGKENISVDDKGRFSVPAAIRSSLPAEAENTFMIVRGTEGCLFAYPKNDWLRFWEGLISQPVTRENTRLKNRILSTLKETKLDGQGRVTLTQELKDIAGIRDAIVLMGAGDKLLLWNNEAWAQYQAEAEKSSTYDDDYYRALESDRNRNDR